MGRAYSVEYESALAMVANIEAEEKKRRARWRRNQARYRRSKKHKRHLAQARKLRKGPTVIGVATEAKTLKRVASAIAAMCRRALRNAFRPSMTMPGGRQSTDRPPSPREARLRPSFSFQTKSGPVKAASYPIWLWHNRRLR
jgi:hypothetical protein